MNSESSKKHKSAEYLEAGSQESESTPPPRFVHQQLAVLLQELYDQGKKELREVDIVNAYIAQLKKESGIEYSYNDLQPNVNRALKKLYKDKKVQKVERRYYLVHPDNTKEVAEKTLVSNVRLQRRDMFTVSISTVILYPTVETIEIAKTWLLKYLGASCYGIANHDGYLIIMLIGKKDQLAVLRKDLKLLAAKIYDKHTR